MLIDQSTQIIISFRVLLGFLAGVLIGIDREKNGKVAGIRTQMLVCAGSALFSGLSIYLARSLGILDQDPTRVIAQIVSGIGFLGAGVILKNGSRLSGVTTAATIWVTAAVGTAIGCGFYIPAAVMVFLVLLLNPIAYLQYKLGIKGRLYVLTFHKKYLDVVNDCLSQQGIKQVQKSIVKNNINLRIMSSVYKNEKIITTLDGCNMRFSLEGLDE